MTSMKDGGPAFPIPNASDMDGYVYASEARGMSLRDYFANSVFGAAMANAENLGLMTQEDRGEAFAQVAGLAYEAADAMLKARGR